jgi:hypothetical protein
MTVKAELEAMVKALIKARVNAMVASPHRTHGQNMQMTAHHTGAPQLLNACLGFGTTDARRGSRCLRHCDSHCDSLNNTQNNHLPTVYVEENVATLLDRSRGGASAQSTYSMG